MSRKTKLSAAIREAVMQGRGAHLTREARIRTVDKFVNVMFDKGVTHMESARDIEIRHLKLFCENQLEAGLSIRTIQNQMSHLRMVLRQVRRGDVGSGEEASNKKLGIDGGSRIGTKTAMSVSEFDAVVCRAIEKGRPGIGHCLKLEREFGLRGNEALHADEETLLRWIRELENCRQIHVSAGTKGGRKRWVTVHDVPHGMAILVEARKTAQSQGGFLVSRKNGAKVEGLKQARSIYHGWSFRAGIQPHSLRYAFSKSQLEKYLSCGYKKRNALKALSADLGHGSGRARWVKSVYLR